MFFSPNIQEFSFKKILKILPKMAWLAILPINSLLAVKNYCPMVYICRHRRIMCRITLSLYTMNDIIIDFLLFPTNKEIIKKYTVISIKLYSRFSKKIKFSLCVQMKKINNNSTKNTINWFSHLSRCYSDYKKLRVILT